MFLIKKLHEKDFHFDCLLSSLEEAQSYVDNDENYTITQIKVPYNKNDFFLKINNKTVQDKRDKEQSFLERREKEEKEGKNRIY
jgi:hypothetical protein